MHPSVSNLLALPVTECLWDGHMSVGDQSVRMDLTASVRHSSD